MPRAGAAYRRTPGGRSVEKEQTKPYVASGMTGLGGRKGRRGEQEESRAGPSRTQLPPRDRMAGEAHWDLYPPVSENGVAAEKRERGTSVRLVAVK